jgi:hypothetical protein
MRFMANELTNYEKENILLTNRFLTCSKESAFSKAQELNKLHTGKKWLVGMRIKDRIAIDIDNHDESNFKKVLWFYSRLFACEFITIKTMHGYHLLQKHVIHKDSLDLLRAKVLVPGLTSARLLEYQNAVKMYFDIEKEVTQGKDYSLQELQQRAKEKPARITEAGLNHSVGNIDVLHALLGIQRGYYVIRISKKTKDEKMELMEP